jgi:diaminopimelate decarboxylase
MRRYLAAGHKGRLIINGHCADDLAKKYGSPLFVFLEERIFENIRQVQAAYSKFFKNFKIHYATKACSNAEILDVIRRAGAGAEVNSGGELEKAIDAGFHKDEIVFNGVSKSYAELELAVSSGIHSINVDSISELIRIVDVARKLGTTANISLRVVPEVKGGTVAGFETGHGNCKFGLLPSDLDEVGKIMLANSETLCFRGFHYHVGSQVINSDAFTDALANIIDIDRRFFKDTGFKSSCLNMGGGLPIPLIPGKVAPTHGDGSALPLEVQRLILGDLPVDQIAERSSSTWDSSETYLDKNETLVQIEPGRRIIGDAGLLLSTVEHLKKRSGGLEWAMLDVGFNILPEILFYDWYYHVVSASRFTDAHDKGFRLAGPLCDTGDSFHDERTGSKLPDSRPLPTKTQQDDILAILNTGAYAIEQQSNYNGRPRASAILIGSNGDIKSLS